MGGSEEVYRLLFFRERLLRTARVQEHRGYSEQYKHNIYRIRDVPDQKIRKMCACWMGKIGMLVEEGKWSHQVSGRGLEGEKTTKCKAPRFSITIIFETCSGLCGSDLSDSHEKNNRCGIMMFQKAKSISNLIQERRSFSSSNEDVAWRRN